MSENVKNMEGGTEASKNNITILIGPNGSGKTTYIKNRIKEFEEFENSKGVFNLSSENVTSLHEKASSPFQGVIKDMDSEFIKDALESELKNLSNEEAGKVNLKKKTIETEKDHKKKWSTLNNEIIGKIKDDILDKTTWKSKLISNWKSELISNKEYSLEPKGFESEKFSLKKQYKIKEEIISPNWVFKFNNNEIAIDDAPSGVKKVLLLYLQVTKHTTVGPNNSPTKRLFVIEEIENYLHPSWIKLCISILIKIFENLGRDEIIISTHSPEVIVLLGDYIEFFATPKNFGKNIDRMDLNRAMKKFKEIISACRLNSKISHVSNIDDYILEIKSILSFEFGRFLLEENSPVILCEGITDKLLIRNHTKSLVTNTFGYYNFGIYMSLYFGLYKEWNKKWRIMADGDDKLDKPKSSQAKFKKYFIKTIGLRKENVFYFKKDLENDLYNCNCKNHNNRQRGKTENPTSWKFRLLREVGLGMKKVDIENANKDFYNFLFETSQEENN